MIFDWERSVFFDRLACVAHSIEDVHLQGVTATCDSAVHVYFRCKLAAYLLYALQLHLGLFITWLQFKCLSVVSLSLLNSSHLKAGCTPSQVSFSIGTVQRHGLRAISFCCSVSTVSTEN